MCGIAALLGCSACGGGDGGNIAAAAARLLPALRRRGPDGVATRTVECGDGVEATLLAAVLQLRGEEGAAQPAVSPAGDVLVWNGEVFGGLAVPPTSSDTPVVLRHFAAAAAAAGPRDAGAALAAAAGALCGPFAFAFTRAGAGSTSLYFARDPLGRRSLLLHLPAPSGGGSVVAVSSTAIPRWAECGGAGSGGEALVHPVTELPPLGVYELRVEGSSHVSVTGSTPPVACVPLCCGRRAVLTCWPWPADIPARAGVLARPPLPAHAAALPDFSDAVVAAGAVALIRALSEAVRLRVAGVRPPLAPPPPALAATPALQAGAPADAVDAWLAVAGVYRGGGGGGAGASARPAHVAEATALLARARAGVGVTAGDGAGEWQGLPHSATAHVASLLSGAAGVAPAAPPPPAPTAAVGVLFSGGIDSMVLARLAHAHVPAGAPIDLINVCFDAAHRSPDRLAAIAGLEELRAVCPGRPWQLVRVDEAFDAVLAAAPAVAAALEPRHSHMD